VGPIVVIEILPFPYFFVEELRIVDDHAVQHPIELILIDPVAAFDFPIQPRVSGPNIDVLDSLVQDMPMKLTSEFPAVICLNDMSPERQS